MVNFTQCEHLKRGYAGANGNKISVRYNGDIYMLKFPSNIKEYIAEDNEEMAVKTIQDITQIF